MPKLSISYPSYQQPKVVTFGSGSLREMAAQDSLERSFIFLSGVPEVRAAVEQVLQRKGHSLQNLPHCVKPPGEPTVAMIEAGAAALGLNGCDRLVAIGGGSVLDWSRLCWAHAEGLLALDSGKVARRSTGQSRPELWLVPTTCGTGAEAAAVAVYRHGDRKVPAVSQDFLADRVLLDGHFLDSVSPGDLACYLSDTLSHAIEGFLSLVPIYLAKEAALSALRLVLEEYAAEPGPCRNERLMDAGYLGGVAASNCSVGVVHAFAHAVSAWGVGHGLGNALGLVAGIETNAGTEAMSHLLSRIGLSSADELAARVHPIVRAAISSRLDFDILDRLKGSAGRAEVVQRMLADVCLRTNPRPLGREEVATFVEDVQRTAAA